MDNFLALGHNRLHVGYVYLLAAFLAVSPAFAQWSSSDSSNLSDIQQNVEVTAAYLQDYYFTWLDDLLPLVQQILSSASSISNEFGQANQSLDTLVASGAISTNLLNQINTHLTGIRNVILPQLRTLLSNTYSVINNSIFPSLTSAEQYLYALQSYAPQIASDTSLIQSQGSQVLQDLVFIESGIDGIISAINNIEFNCDCSAGYTIISNWYGSWFGWFGEDGRFELIIDATIEIIDKLEELANLGVYLTQISGQIDDLQNAILAEMRSEFRWWTNTVYSVMTDRIPSGFDARGVFDTSQASFVNYQDFVDTSQAVTNFEFSEQTWNSNFFQSANSALATEGNQSVWLSRLTDVNSSRLNDLALDGLDAFEANFEQGGDIYIDAFTILGQSSSNIQIPLSIITENNDIKTFFSNMWRFIVLCCKLGVTIALSFKITRMVAGESGKNPLGV